MVAMERGNFLIPASLKEKSMSAAHKLGIGWGAFIRRALTEILKKQEKKGG